MYPTLASMSPLLANVWRYMCSTPQKQPAATVAFWAPSGRVIEAAIGADENGRVRREKNEVIRRTRDEAKRMDLVVGMVELVAEYLRFSSSG
jgi:hypothetical protein